ncbi:MAG: Wzz/FepE/Etk N-terminal domain-containing protein [Woeseiaceae bacterium]|nr:Wzz/FepE/Etk N-terminal domain-containing protein [Woeseiaceae bacterium]
MSETELIEDRGDNEDLISLRALSSDLWQGKWTILGVTSFFAITSIVVSLMIPNYYRSSVLLAPTERESSGGLAALASEYSGFASFAGLNIPSGNSDQVELGLEILKSRKFLASFIERRDLLVPLMAGKEWNFETNILEIDADIYNTETQEWVREVSPPYTVVPSSLEAVEAFEEILNVSRDKTTGFVTVSIEFLSPQLARDWVSWLIADLNKEMMTHDVRIAEETIDYLQKQVNSTSLTGLQQVFFKLIEEQTKVIVLSEVTDEYLLRTIDPAVVPEKKSRPFRSIIVIVSTFIGGFAGVLIHLLRLQLAPAKRD